MTRRTGWSRSGRRCAEWLVVAVLSGVTLSGVALGGCGTPPASRFDGGPPVNLASNENPAVFEGQGRVVTVLTATGEDLTGATVTAEDDGLVVIESACAGERCAVVVAVPDIVPDEGRAIPSPIDATNRYLRIIRAGEDDYRALFSVAPLDAIANGGGSASVRGVYFAASVDSVADTVFRGALGLEPVRWYVFGDAHLRGVVDVSADGAMPGPGALAGAAIGGTNTGPEGGGPGSATAGAGGGASAANGEPGEGASSGVGGMAFGSACALDAFADACGGAGGGSAAGPGGGGGGAFVLVALGDLDTDVEIDATGADGLEGGGGGGGGRVYLSGSSTSGVGARVDVGGGLGGPRAGAGGGAGGDGESTVTALDGPSLDAPSAWITRDPSWPLSGRARPLAMIEVETLAGVPAGMATAGADGRFTIMVTLAAGLNRLRVTEVASDGTRRRMFTGNHFELQRRGTELLPVGGLLDVAYLP
jgi:hypothetical protein